MNILYASSVCSKKKLDLLFNMSIEKPAVQGIKYNRLLIEGLSHSKENNIETISAVQMSRKLSKKIFWSYEKETEQCINYNYLPFVNIPILRNVILFFSSLIYTLSCTHRKSETIVIGDVLSASVSIAALLGAKIKGFKTVAVITDLPKFQNQSQKYRKGIYLIQAKLVRFFRDIFINLYDGYILLTEDMNEVVNSQRKPYVIIEGIADIDMQLVDNAIENKNNKKVFLYAGALHEKYGLLKLINSFISIENDDIELWIYGKGAMEDKIKKISEKNKKVKFFGMVPNDEVILSEVQASVLVNPRPSIEEFTKYSFPSKNIEYMASGTPVLTTPLPGMPKDYYDYIYIFDDESERGMKNTILELSTKSAYELHLKGVNAKQYILTNKSNIAQANKVNILIRKLISSCN